MVSEVLSAMTDEQKAQIVSGAVAGLTDEQKKQILNGAHSSLTKKQKEEIKNGYVKQMMAEKTVTNQISKAVKEADKSAAQIVELKGQLDNYGAFYQGIVSYTSAVSQVANGAGKLHTGLDTLYENTDILKNAVGDLDNAMGDLCDGTKELAEGTGEFAEETEGMETKMEDEIDAMVSSVSGKEVEVVAFVSEENTNIKSVQFVMKTDNIVSEVEEITREQEEEQLSFGQKLLRLFGR